MSKLIKNLTIILSLTIGSYANANANSIDTLERERAKALNLVLDKNISIGLEKDLKRTLTLEVITLPSLSKNAACGILIIVAELYLIKVSFEVSIL